MPELRDSDLPREERLFARVPKTTNDKIAYLAKRWGRGKILSTADVIVKVVDRAYVESKGDLNMLNPTERSLLQRIKSGKVDVGILPVLPDLAGIGPGDILTFREATFSVHQIPTFVPGGESVSMRITKAEDTGEKYGGCRLYSFRWQGIGNDGRTPQPAV
jgi:hypothetical protein